MKIIQTDSPIDNVQNYIKGLVDLTPEPVCRIHYHMEHHTSDSDSIFYHVPEFDALSTIISMSSTYKDITSSSEIRDHIPCYDFIKRAHDVLEELRPYVTGDKQHTVLVYIDTFTNLFLQAKDIKNEYFLFEERYHDFVDAVINDTISS